MKIKFQQFLLKFYLHFTNPAKFTIFLFTLHKFPIPQHQQVDRKFIFGGEVEELVRLWLKAIVFDERFVIHFRISKIDFKNL